MASHYMRKYGVQAVIPFELYETDGTDLKSDAAHASGDTKIMKDEAAEANTSNGFVDEGQGYSITLTNTEMEAARIVVYVVDQGTKAWLDKVLIIETYGNASAEHAFDLDTATVNLSSATETQIDNIETYTDKIDDATDGLTAIKAEVEGLGGEAMRGTNNASTHAAADIWSVGSRALTDKAGFSISGTKQTLDALNDLSSANAETACGNALTSYDPPTRAELTSDKNAIITEVDANETKIDALNDLGSSDVETACGNALTTYDPPTKSEMDSGFAGLNDISTAQVNAEVVDALNVDTYGEPGQENPPATTTLVKKIGYLFKAWRNKKTNDGTDRKLYDDAGTTVDQKSGVSESSSTVTTNEWETGP